MPTPEPSPRSPRRRRGAGRRFLVVGDVVDALTVLTAAETGGDDPDAVVRHRLGGGGGNAASWLGRLGADVDLVARVGVDDAYRHGDALRRAGVRPHLASGPEAGTGVSVAVRGADGSWSTMTEGAAAGLLTVADVPPDVMASADVVLVTGAALLGGGPDVLAAVVEAARRSGARVAVDPSSARRVRTIGATAFLEAVAGADLLLPGADELHALSGSADVDEGLARLTDRFPLVVTTLGAAGAVVGRPHRSPRRVPATPAEVVDPIGAGDAFAAGFLCAWATDPVRVGSAAAEGARVAARALGTVGGRPPV